MPDGLAVGLFPCAAAVTRSRGRWTRRALVMVCRSSSNVEPTGRSSLWLGAITASDVPPDVNTHSADGSRRAESLQQASLPVHSRDGHAIPLANHVDGAVRLP